MRSARTDITYLALKPLEFRAALQL